MYTLLTYIFSFPTFGYVLRRYYHDVWTLITLLWHSTVKRYVGRMDQK